ncbi:MAG: cyclomaltodextrinase / maltogenic alpha-amylase / neopullulanase [Abditibacteriota bacterium]|nr:cyclomaltodextrinase / maltogenic alpha-amylase / neopullulanase [Abditibacteriota bacterium]
MRNCYKAQHTMLSFSILFAQSLFTQSLRRVLTAGVVALALGSALFSAPQAGAQAAPPGGAPLQTVQTVQTVSHTFVYNANTPLKSVAIAGSFNNWDRNANLLTSGGAGQWRTTLRLPYGKHSYKFVLDGERWVTDPNAARNENDGNGNLNSVLVLLPLDYARPASARDGVIARSALLHQTSVPHLNYDRGALTLSLRARPGDVRQVRVKFGSRTYPMALVDSGDLYARYQTRLPWERKRDVSYLFELVDGARVLRFGANGLGAAPQVRPFVLRAASFQPFQVPGWVERTVFYQIFPDRFENGDKSNDPADVQPWNAKPEYWNRFGGDVTGVRRRIGHLTELGISAVYFNPIFKSPSNHRYDAEDFHSIDPQFGTTAEFASLTRDLKAHNIRTILDFVFNHTATTFKPFLDIRQNGEASPYKQWYFIKSYPVRVQENPNYVAWFNYPSMPKLNLGNPETHDYMLNLVDYWHRQLPMAGLRLDVANEVDPNFWRDLRKRVKRIDPQMWIVGEVWGDGSPWLSGDQWDSVMNYQFRDASLRFFAEGKTTPSQFMKRLMQVHTGYANQVSRNMMNLLSSHDTPRFLTLCGNNANLHQLAATVQFTWVGAPSIYYGEELGMQGGADPDNRRGMEWQRATPDNAMLNFYKRLIRLRNANRALQSGDPKVLLTDDRANVAAYARVLNNEAAIVAINRSNTARTLSIPLPRGAALQAWRKTGIIDGLSGRRVALPAGSVLRLTLPALRAIVLVPRGRSKSPIAGTSRIQSTLRSRPERWKRYSQVDEMLAAGPVSLTL